MNMSKALITFALVSGFSSVSWASEYIDLAAPSKDPATLYAATQSGLLKSEDGGRSW